MATAQPEILEQPMPYHIAQYGDMQFTPNPVPPGEELSVSYQVCNDGDDTAVGILSQGTLYSTSGNPVAVTRLVENYTVAAGVTAIVNHRQPIPPDTPPGNYAYEIVLDMAADVPAILHGTFAVSDNPY
jgi:hypothetical protein